jgi:hypothetical protein
MSRSSTAVTTPLRVSADLLRLHEYPVADLDHRRPPQDDDGTSISSVPKVRWLHSRHVVVASLWQSGRCHGGGRDVTGQTTDPIRPAAMRGGGDGVGAIELGISMPATAGPGAFGEAGLSPGQVVRSRSKNKR